MITIVDYKAGNITSVQRALSFLGLPNEVTNAPEKVAKAERIIFPGVGHARAAMAYLRASGLEDALREAFAAGTPILGICLGTQIIMSHSEEGDTPCLGLIPGECVRFPQDMGLKVPHMGWNQLKTLRPHPVLPDAPGVSYYFVHSYYIKPADEFHTVALCDYGLDFPAVVARDNLIAMQFHPEKSGPNGLRIFERFAAWRGGGADAE